MMLEQNNHSYVSTQILMLQIHTKNALRTLDSKFEKTFA